MLSFPILLYGTGMQLRRGIGDGQRLGYLIMVANLLTFTRYRLDRAAVDQAGAAGEAR